jgi:hypothetical protein
MAALTKLEFETALRCAVQRREATDYDNFFSLHFHWEDDHDRASHDESNFRQILDLLGFPPGVTEIISKETQTPRSKVQHHIIDLLDKAALTPGRSIFLIHYAGHAREDDVIPKSGLELCGSSRDTERIWTDGLLGNLHLDFMLPSGSPVDVIVIFDCCYTFSASRKPDPQSRVVEILCAGDVPHPTYSFRFPLSDPFTGSITSKLLAEIKSRRQRGDTHVEIADLMDSLPLNPGKVFSSYVPQVGLRSISLRLPAAARSDGMSPTGIVPSAGIRATFSIRVS